MLIIKKLTIMTVVYSLLFQSLVQAQQIVKKELSELKEGAVFCYFTKYQRLTNSKVDSYYYRKLIKKNTGKDDSLYIIQDFYSKTDKKQIDPVTLMDEKELYRFPPLHIEGAYVKWSIEGKKEAEGIFKKGLLQGEYNTWYESGQLKSKAHLLNGKLDGVTTTWNEAGTKISEVSFARGRMDGLTQEWFSDGRKNYSAEYKNNRRDGEYIEWRDDKPILIGYFKNGNTAVLWRWWNVNGNKIREGSYDDGYEEGVWITWSDSGQKLQEITYKHGRYNGLVMQWDEKGNLTRHEIYESGKSIWDGAPFLFREL